LEIEKGEKLMKLINNRFVQVAAALAVVATLALVTPRAAHAFAAALVQVSNTTESPAITQSAGSQASQLVLLSANVLPNSTANFYSTGSGNIPFNSYTVSSTQSLVVTAVDITPSVGCTTGSYHFVLLGNNILDPAMMWTLSAPNTGHYPYPSGIVFVSNSQPQISLSHASTNSGDCANAAEVNLLGYLTYN
jgi:hypothetical protein